MFAEAAKKIDPEKSAAEVFRQIQSEYPAAEELIPEITKKLESIRKFVIEHKLVTIPTEVRAQVKETPQHLRAISFASMDAPGPYEKRATEAYFYVTPPENEWPEHQKNEWLSRVQSLQRRPHFDARNLSGALRPVSPPECFQGHQTGKDFWQHCPTSRAGRITAKK